MDLTIKYRSKSRSIKSFDSFEPIPEDIVRREMDKQKEAKEKIFHDRETLKRDFATIRGRTNASLYDLLKQDECINDALNKLMNKIQDRRKLFKTQEISEVPNRKQILPFGFRQILEDLGVGCDDFALSAPWDFEYRYAFVLGNPLIDVQADKSSGIIRLYATTQGNEYFNDLTIAQVGGMLGASFSPSPHNGLLLLREDSWYEYNWFVYVFGLLMAGVAAYAGIQVDRYTLDNVFDQTVVNNTVLLWNYTAFSTSEADNGPNGNTDSDAFITASLDVDKDHRYVIWVKFEILIEADEHVLFFNYDAADAYLRCNFPWIEGGFCPSD